MIDKQKTTDQDIQSLKNEMVENRKEMAENKKLIQQINTSTQEHLKSGK